MNTNKKFKSNNEVIDIVQYLQFKLIRSNIIANKNVQVI